MGRRPPLWSSGRSSWLWIQRSAFDSRRYQIFWEVVGLERGTLSLVSTLEELHGRNSSGSSLESREYGRGNPLRWPCDILYPQRLTLTSPTSGVRSVGIVRSRTKATDFSFLVDDENEKLRFEYFNLWTNSVAILASAQLPEDSQEWSKNVAQFNFNLNIILL
jgi:hypothetical protein